MGQKNWCIMKNLEVELKELVLDTANATLIISVNKEGKWYATIGDKGARVEEEGLKQLVPSIISYLKENRKVKEPTKRSLKNFTL